jgi:hypothetical protein
VAAAKVYDLHRVEINSSEEERQFLAVVNREDWMLDAVTSHWEPEASAWKL